MKEQINPPTLEKILKEGFEATEEEVHPKCTLYKRGDYRLIYDVQRDLEVIRYRENMMEDY